MFIVYQIIINITFYEYSCSQIKVKLKPNSFDRFGDDLTEEILQYLTFEDKIKLECVSKQWRRLVFNKEFVIELNFCRYERQKPFNRLKDLRKLKTLLKKCPNITKVILFPEKKSSVLSLIGRYCHHIKSLTYEVYAIDDNVLSFFRKYGHKLEKLVLFGTNGLKEQILILCPNVKKVLIPEFNILFNEDKEFLPKLEHIFINFQITSQNVNEMKILSDKYSQTMKTLNVMLEDLEMTREEVIKCFEYISRFENLRDLTLRIECIRLREPIDDCLSLIGQKCNKLLKLDLTVKGCLRSLRFLTSFSEF